MDKFDLVATLRQYGVDERKATQLKAQLKGEDLINLVGALNAGPQGSSLAKADSILGKYGVKLGSRKDMNNYLGAKYESLKSGQALDETFGVMKKMDEAFTYAVEVSEQSRDRVLDWLDENSVNYQATSPTNYRIECGDREGAYRTGRALSEILRKPTVRDSVEIEEKMSKNPNKRVKDAQDKMANLKPRNPVAVGAKIRSGAGAHDGGKDPRKQDKFGRGTKHRPRFDEEIEYTVGQDVMVGEDHGTIKIPRGPNGTIGVIVNGDLQMVGEAEVHLSEGVLGAMKPVNPLFRLRELAGLPLTNEDDFEGIEIPEVPSSDPLGPLAAGTVGDEPEDLDVDGMGDDPMTDPMTDMDGGMDASMEDPTLDGMDSEIADPMGDEGVPGELGSDPLEMPGDLGDVGSDPVPSVGAPMAGAPMAGAPMAPMQSEAMAAIEDSLNSIQTGLADIRLSEYKSLIQKLQDLTNQAQMMGRDYLGERFERKKK